MACLLSIQWIIAFLVRAAALCWLLLISFSFFSFLLPVADSVAHFRLHLSGALLMAGFYLLAVQNWRLGLSGVGVALAGVISTSSVWAVAPETDCPVGVSVKVMQLNLFYRNSTVEKAAWHIKTERPDIVALQEVSAQTKRVLDDVRDMLPYQKQCRFSTVGHIAVLSRFPFVEGRCIVRKGLVWVRIQAHGKDVSIASLHLHWPFPYWQHGQIKQLQSELQRIPHPLILAGDFNAAPWSHAVQKIGEASLSRIASGIKNTLFKRFGVTGFKVRIGLPIDHIMISRELKTCSIKRGRFVGSDHRPVIGVFAFSRI